VHSAQICPQSSRECRSRDPGSGSLVNYLESASTSSHGEDKDGGGDSYYAFSIIEDAGKKEQAIGREVDRVHLKPSNKKVPPKYSFVDGDQLAVLSIDENTDILTTAKRINREI